MSICLHPMDKHDCIIRSTDLPLLNQTVQTYWSSLARSVLTASGSVEYSIKSVELQFRIFIWLPCGDMNIDKVNYILISIFFFYHFYFWPIRGQHYLQLIIIRVLLHRCKQAHLEFTYNNKQMYFGGKFELLHFESLHLWHLKTVQCDSLELAVNKNINPSCRKMQIKLDPPFKFLYWLRTLLYWTWVWGLQSCKLVHSNSPSWFYYT